MRRLWDNVLLYMQDLDDGVLSLEDMLTTLERQDGMRVDWKIRLPEEKK